MNYFMEAIGYLAGICVSICFLPQTLRTMKTKEVNGLSLMSYSIYSIGILSWVIYGFYLSSLQMIIFNAISLFFALCILYMIIKYKQK